MDRETASKVLTTVANPGLIVLTNDDGIDAPGIAAMREAIRARPESSWVVAPLLPRSGCSHAVTTRKPIEVHERGHGMTAINGTPADCVRVAIHRIGRDVAWVLSGINEGGNLGADIHISGTVAAVREAALHGVPGIAVSHYHARGRIIDWDRAARWTSAILDELMVRPPGPGEFWNVNLPHPEHGAPDPEVVYCPTDPSPLQLSFRQEYGGLTYSGDYHERPRVESHDVDVCFGGRIAISKVRVLNSV